MIQYSVAAEAIHEIGREGVIRIRRWLDATGRFAISHSVYDLDDEDRPYTQVRVEQLDGTHENFDLVGDLRDESGKRGRAVLIECKKYSSPGDQGTLYNEYLATAYSAFAAKYEALSHPPSLEFMWITTHPFSVGSFGRLCDETAIKAACTDPKWARRLGGRPYDPSLGAVLAKRLWLVVVNDRMLQEMVMGSRLRVAVTAELTRMGVA